MRLITSLAVSAIAQDDRGFDYGFGDYDLSAFDDEYGFYDSYGDQYDYIANAFDTNVLETVGPGLENDRDGEGTKQSFTGTLLVTVLTP